MLVHALYEMHAYILRCTYEPVFFVDDDDNKQLC